MGDIGLFVSTFGGMGLFIYYLMNRDKTVSKEQTDAINNLGTKVDTQTKVLTSSFDDFSFLLFDLLDSIIDGYGKKGNAKTIKAKLASRRKAKEAKN